MGARNICFVASEAAPFAKTGGLADVVPALAAHLARRGHRVRLFLPMYRRILHAGHDFQPVPRLQDIHLHAGEREYSFSISTLELEREVGGDGSLEAYFVRCPELYDRDGIYTSDGDEHLRFGMLCRAAVESCQWSQWSPDIAHCHDWHTALLPLYLKARYGWDKLFENTKTVLTIHNIGYQGVFPAETLASLGLDGERSLLYQEDLQEDRINFLKTGILYADAITTVSRTYAREIQTEAFGMGLDGLLASRRDSLFGIVNGVDYSLWDPREDRLIPHPYSRDKLAGKGQNKRALLRAMGLSPEAPGSRVPVLGVVTRLTYQKGIEFLAEVLPHLIEQNDLRLVVLGSGEEQYEQYFERLQGSHPDRVCYYRGYSEELAHLIEAGSDIFLMPSRYEPCGMNQMYSLRYGTVPVVRRTGGLADTIREWNPEDGSGTGFLFDGFAPEALYQAVGRALATYRDPRAWERLVRNGMAEDFSWEVQGPLYEEFYERLLARGS